MHIDLDGLLEFVATWERVDVRPLLEYLQRAACLSPEEMEAHYTAARAIVYERSTRPKRGPELSAQPAPTCSDR